MRRWLFALELVAMMPAVIYAQPKSFGDPNVAVAIDREINATLKGNKIAPVGPASDAEFVRRIHLDLLGRIPTAEETTAYLSDKSPDKQRRIVESLLASWEMPAYWCDVLHGWMNGKSADPGLNFKEFREYLRASLADSKPWDQIARELLLPAEGPTQPAIFFLAKRLRIDDKEERLDGLTVAVASTFFGVRMECAKCHDHPYVDDWKQQHYYGLASFLSRTEINNGARPTLRERDGGDVVFQNRKRERFTAKLMFLDDKVLPEPKLPSKEASTRPEHSRRKVLADYAFVPTNPYFKRAIVNRLWKELMGAGLVEPVDQIHRGNVPSHPKLFELLADDFAASGFNLKRLMANILSTEAYRRSSVWPGKDRPKPSEYAVFNLRPLTPEQLAMSLATATGQAEVVKLTRKKTDPREVRVEMEKDYKSFFEHYEDADQFAATTSQALFMTFNKTTQKYLQPAAGNLAARLLKTSDTDSFAQQVALAVLSRPATTEEAGAIAKHLQTQGVPREQLVRDVVWALLNSPEFRFSH